MDNRPAAAHKGLLTVKPVWRSAAYCNTFWFCITEFDSPSNEHLLYLCFSVTFVRLWAVCTSSIDTSICKEPEHFNQSIYYKHSLHNTSCDGLWVWLQTASFVHCENQPFHLGTSVCVVCEVKAHCSLTQARRDAHHQFGFEILETFSCRPQDILSSFLLRLGFVFLSLEVICSCCLFPHS